VGFINDNRKFPSFDIIHLVENDRKFLQGGNYDFFAVIDCVFEVLACFLIIYALNQSGFVVKTAYGVL